MRIVIEATLAIPRSRPVSSRVRPVGPPRAITSRAPGGCSSGAAAAEAAPTPGISRADPSIPGFTASSSPMGAVPPGYPIAAMSWPSQTMAATSASSASAARSTAVVAADASFSAAETAATNSASCCVDQPDVPINDRADQSQVAAHAPPRASGALLNSHGQFDPETTIRLNGNLGIHTPATLLGTRFGSKPRSHRAGINPRA